MQKVLITNALKKLHRALKETMESSDIFLASNQFGLDVFKILYEKQKSGNSFISPIVLASSVAALYMGASEDTRKRIAKALRLDNNVGEEHVLKLQSYLKALQTQCADHVTLSSGIKILLDKKWNCLDGFKHKIQQLPFTGKLCFCFFFKVKNIRGVMTEY